VTFEAFLETFFKAFFELFFELFFEAVFNYGNPPGEEVVARGRGW
jgi:hypothetical protein